MNPACAMEENAKKRFMFCCRKANKLPMNMVKTATTYIIFSQICINGFKTVNSKIIRMNTAAPFEITER